MSAIQVVRRDQVRLARIDPGETLPREQDEGRWGSLTYRSNRTPRAQPGPFIQTFYRPRRVDGRYGVIVVTLHLMCGLPLSGKTTLAHRLEQEHSALRLTPDEWIAGLLPRDWERAELDRLRDPVEAIQWDVAARALVLGIDVILDWGLWNRSERDDLRARASALGAAVQVHFCDAELHVLLKRSQIRSSNLRHGEFQIEEHDLRTWSDAFERPTPDEFAVVG